MSDSPDTSLGSAPTSALSRAAIERLLPQKGAMCLIDAATEVTAEAIVCLATVWLQGNPLGEALGVPALHGVEYGAQAAALHRLVRGGDRERSAVSGGLLLQVRELRCFVEYLDQLPQPLRISARCAMASSEIARYVFEIHAADLLALRGELTLKLT